MAISITERSSFLLILIFLAHFLNQTVADPLSPTTGTTVILPLSGNVYPKAYFSADLDIGQPPKIFDLDVDTGSSITWVQCDAPCEVGCTKPENQRYKPKEENFVRCDDPICESVSKKRCRDPNDKCYYDIKFTDMSNTSGFLVRDNFPLRFTNGTVIRPRLVFGCGYKLYFREDHPSKATGGVFGFSDGKISILTQLRDMGFIKNVGGHCLSSKGGGFIFLGDVPDSSSNIAWVPRKIKKKSEEKLYITGPAELFHDRSPITSTTGMEPHFDSGSTYTYLRLEYYQKVFNQIKEDVKGKPLEKTKPDPKFDICWKSTKKPFKSIDEVKSFFKPFMLKYANNKELQFPPEAYLILVKNGVVCLGFQKGAEGDHNTVGDVSMQDRMIIFDNEKKEIGWVSSANCTTFPSPEPIFKLNRYST